MDYRMGNAMVATMTDWNRRYEEGDTPWEKGKAHPVLGDMITHRALSGRVLVPGCGTGHDVRELTRKGLDVLGLDVAPLAIKHARGHEPAGAEQYFLGSIFDLPREWRGAFDGAFEHTCFCAIDPARRRDYASSVAGVLKPGGRFLAVFYANPDNDEDGPPFGCTREELDKLFGMDFRLLEERWEIPTYEGRVGRELLRLYERV